MVVYASNDMVAFFILLGNGMRETLKSAFAPITKRGANVFKQLQQSPQQLQPVQSPPSQPQPQPEEIPLLENTTLNNPLVNTIAPQKDIIEMQDPYRGDYGNEKTWRFFDKKDENGNVIKKKQPDAPEGWNDDLLRYFKEEEKGSWEDDAQHFLDGANIGWKRDEYKKYYEWYKRNNSKIKTQETTQEEIENSVKKLQQDEDIGKFISDYQGLEKQPLSKLMETFKQNNPEWIKENEAKEERGVLNTISDYFKDNIAVNSVSDQFIINKDSSKKYIINRESETANARDIYELFEKGTITEEQAKAEIKKNYKKGDYIKPGEKGWDSKVELSAMQDEDVDYIWNGLVKAKKEVYKRQGQYKQDIETLLKGEQINDYFKKDFADGMSEIVDAVNNSTLSDKSSIKIQSFQRLNGVKERFIGELGTALEVIQKYGGKDYNSLTADEQITFDTAKNTLEAAKQSLKATAEYIAESIKQNQGNNFTLQGEVNGKSINTYIKEKVPMLQNLGKEAWSLVPDSTKSPIDYIIASNSAIGYRESGGGLWDTSIHYINPSGQALGELGQQTIGRIMAGGADFALIDADFAKLNNISNERGISSMIMNDYYTTWQENLPEVVGQFAPEILKAGISGGVSLAASMGVNIPKLTMLSRFAKLANYGDKIADISKTTERVEETVKGIKILEQGAEATSLLEKGYEVVDTIQDANGITKQILASADKASKIKAERTERLANIAKGAESLVDDATFKNEKLKWIVKNSVKGVLRDQVKDAQMSHFDAEKYSTTSFGLSVGATLLTEVLPIFNKAFGWSGKLLNKGGLFNSAQSAFDILKQNDHLAGAIKSTLSPNEKIGFQTIMDNLKGMQQLEGYLEQYVKELPATSKAQLNQSLKQQVINYMSQVIKGESTNTASTIINAMLDDRTSVADALKLMGWFDGKVKFAGWTSIVEPTAGRPIVKSIKYDNASKLDTIPGGFTVNEGFSREQMNALKDLGYQEADLLNKETSSKFFKKDTHQDIWRLTEDGEKLFNIEIRQGDIGTVSITSKDTTDFINKMIDTNASKISPAMLDRIKETDAFNKLVERASELIC